MKVNPERPILGITMGDPGGIGPEICVKALAEPSIHEVCRPIVIGDAAVLAEAIKFCRLTCRIHRVAEPAAGQYNAGTIDVLDLANLPLDLLRYGTVTSLQGKASFEYIVRAIELARADVIDGNVTGPISKASINAAGHHFAGHTEIYAHFTETRSYSMMLVEGAFRVSHVSTHVALREACERVKMPRVLKVIELTHQALLQMGIQRPRIAVSGLNPHCGEGGLFGTEDDQEVVPAVAAANAAGMLTEGPLPGDSIFPKLHGGMYDAVVAMYHDQGHIPTKLLGYRYDARTGAWSQMAGVNVTLGLPIIRTSVDHGTAFDKAGEGCANPQSMIEAIKLAAVMAARRKAER